MSHESSQAVPFVFQVSSALREFMMNHSGENVVDLSIGTPPTSVAIRAKQMELIFGTSENPFAEGSLEADFFKEFERIIFNMGKYEATGGRASIKEEMMSQNENNILAEDKSMTLVSGGSMKAFDLWEVVKKEVGGLEVFLTDKKERALAPETAATAKTPVIFSDPFMKRSSLALFIGLSHMVKAVESLHTCIAGTPSAPQEDLFLFLKNTKYKEYLENSNNEENEHCLSEILEFISLINREPIPFLIEEGTRLRKKFGQEFLRCFFPKMLTESTMVRTNTNLPLPVHIVCGNGGGREALNIIEKILVKRGLSDMILFQPHWTYNNVYRQSKLISLSPAESGEPDVSVLEKKLAELSRDGKIAAITINSPNNPSGVIYSKTVLEQLLILCQKYKVFVIDDDCYLQIVRRDENGASVLDVAWQMVQDGRLEAKFLKNIFVALTASKGLGMAGGRIGAVVFFDADCAVEIEEYYAAEFPNLLSFFLAHKLSEDSAAFLELLKEINREVDTRVEAVTKFLDENKLEYTQPAGAFYLEMKVPFLKKMVTDMKLFALKMAKEKGVAFMPMEVFGGEKYAIRLSLGGEKSAAQLRQEMEVLVSVLNEFWLL